MGVMRLEHVQPRQISLRGVPSLSAGYARCLRGLRIPYRSAYQYVLSHVLHIKANRI